MAANGPQPPIRGSHPRLKTHLDQRRAALVAENHMVSVVPNSRDRVYRVRSAAVRARRGPDKYTPSYVLCGTHRRVFIDDADAVRLTHTVQVGGTAYRFPLQAGTIIPANKTWALMPVACTCKDWKYRGTEHTATAQELAASAGAGNGWRSQQSVRHTEQHQHKRNMTVRGWTMGAVHGCKHMAAVHDLLLED